MTTTFLQGNKLIGEFMGGVINENGDRLFPRDLPKYFEWIGTLLPKDMQYNSDWGWIMPVIQKIGSDYDVRIMLFPKSMDVTYIDRPDIDEGEISSMGGMSPLHNTWWAVVHFIEWYNAESPYRIKS